MRSGPGDDGQRGEWAAARRRVARRHHPDVGGDPDEFVRSLADVDARFTPAPATPGRSAARRVTTLKGLYRLKRTRYALRRGRRAGARRIRSTLPRHFPGSRRTIEL